MLNISLIKYFETNVSSSMMHVDCAHLGNHGYQTVIYSMTRYSNLDLSIHTTLLRPSGIGCLGDLQEDECHVNLNSERRRLAM